MGLGDLDELKVDSRKKKNEKQLGIGRREIDTERVVRERQIESREGMKKRERGGGERERKHVKQG